MRILEVCDVGFESEADGFRRDALMMTVVAASDGSLGLMRLWRRPDRTLSLGRYHRLAPGREGLERRLTGGRVVPLGPDVLGLTLIVPRAEWLDSSSASRLGPERVLNRALRPLLAVLRRHGLDVFYPGRDLVTVAGRVVAHASFTVMPDGLLVIEQHVVLEPVLAELPGLLARFDPEGIAATDSTELCAGTCLSEFPFSLPLTAWPSAIAEQADAVLGCRAVVASLPLEGATDLVPAAHAVIEAFRNERGPVAPDSRHALAKTTLGLVEATARVEEGRLREVELSGDLIAPFTTLDRIARGLEGVFYGRDAIARGLKRILSDPKDFVFGVDRLDELLTRVV